MPVLRKKKTPARPKKEAFLRDDDSAISTAPSEGGVSLALSVTSTHKLGHLYEVVGGRSLAGLHKHACLGRRHWQAELHAPNQDKPDKTPGRAGQRALWKHAQPPVCRGHRREARQRATLQTLMRHCVSAEQGTL